MLQRRGEVIARFPSENRAGGIPKNAAPRDSQQIPRSSVVVKVAATNKCQFGETRCGVSVAGLSPPLAA